MPDGVMTYVSSSKPAAAFREGASIAAKKSLEAHSRFEIVTNSKEERYV